MALTVQNLRAVGTGVEPASLLPGQIAFNITDKVLYVGDGSSFKTSFDGTQVAGVPGEGWYAMPMDFASLGDYYVANPGYWGDVPTDQQVLTWSTALNHPIWITGTGGGGSQVYVVSNANVAAASGATTSDKISAAIGVASPDEGNVTIVTGLPDDVYEGLYFFTTEWVKGAAYAYPSASEVIYDNTAHPTLTATVQGAIDDLDDGLIATTAIANTANSTATSALAIASAALPKAGGTMTGTIVAQNINVQTSYGVQFNSGVNGTITGINDSINATSSTIAASGTAVKTAYDIGAAALARSGGTMTGAITFVAGQTFPISGIQIASTSQLGVVQIGTNINVTGGGTISVNSASTSTPGIVQLNDTLSSSSVTEALTARAGADLQTQITSLSVASNIDLGGSLDCTVSPGGTIDSVTAAGTAAGLFVGNPLPAPGPGNVDVYVIVTTGSLSFSPTGGGGPYAPENGDWFLSNGTQWQYLGVGARPSYASTSTAGIIQLGFPADTQAGVNNTLAVTPFTLQSKVSDSTSTTSSTTIASSTAVKAAYDLANAALPKAGGTMTGDITLSGAGVGIVFNDASTVEAISDSVATTSSVTAASSTAVKAAYDLATTANTTANAALPKAGGTMTGAITFVAGQTFPVSGIQDATTVQKGVVQIGTNIDVSSGTISVKSASTTQAGIVQLNNTNSSTSTTQALTANQGKLLQDQINALSTSNNLTFAGTIDGSTGLMLTVTTEGASVGFTVGAVLPSPSATINEYFVIASVAGTMTPPGGVSTQVYVGDWWLASSTTWTYIAAGFQPPYASTTTPGLVRLSTNAETQTGTDATEAVTPASLQSKVSDSTSTTSSTTIASSTAVKSAYDLANAAVPKSIYSALGVIASGTGAGTVGGLALGTTGQFLAANTACGGGIEWCTLSLACIPCSAFTAAGQLLAGTGSSAFTALNVGSNGQFLTVDSTCTGGIKWVTANGANICGFTCALTPFNTVIGATAGALLTGLSVANTAIGYAALDAETVGDFNTAIGHNALTAQNGPTGNTAVGGNAGAQIVGGACNTLMGYNTGDALTTGNNNTALGMNALGATISGGNNVAVGMNALATSTVGCQTAVGYCALASATTGIQNTGLGYFTLNNLIAGNQNTAVGFAAGQFTSGNSNTYLGYNSGNAVTTSSFNTMVGWEAGVTTTNNGNNTYVGACSGRLQTSTNNTAVGTCALANTGVNNNTGVGFAAGAALTTGSSNTFVGATAGDNATTADNAVAVGYNALGAAHTPNGTVAIGANALAANTSGACNTAVGFNAGTAVTTGSNNTMLGYAAGDTVTTGTQNTFLGSGSGGLAATTSEGNTGVGFSALGQGVLSGAYNVALGNNAGLSVTSGAINTLVGFSAGSAITTGGSNTLVGRYAGTAALANNVVLSDGAGTIRFQSNSSGAISLGAGGSYGTAGQILVSGGSGAAPTWSSSLPQVTAPTASTDAGTQGQIASDATYFYMYTGGRWQRVAWDATAW
jgi:hypothetical protein